ncbi:hypothetical protein [Pedobacter antarcticus]|uniref:hypothetical protein n=1 Tax=Pedobacter antarcticus TaxID=34086 RepID=UPI001C56E5E7|nr:hypothetical protein [Pedobacter antarcticus]
MKKLSLVFTLTLGLFFCLNASAQTTADYFAGKWNVTVFGTPNGDAKITLVLEKKGTELTGVVRDSTNTEVSTITQIDQNEKSITAAFNIQNYDVTLTLNPVDQDNTKGTLMNMFDAVGVRVKEN